MKLDITLPTSLSEIPLSRYQQFIEMKDKSNDEEFIAQKMIQIFCGIKLGEVAKIKMKHLNELIAHFTKVFSEKPQLVRKFKIKDLEFGFIPRFDDITFGEYVDLENYLKDWKTYHKALSVMYRPIKTTFKDKYEIVDYEPNEDMQDLMKYAPLDVAISSSFFLSNLGVELLKATQTYLKKELKKMTKDLTNSQKELNFNAIGNGTLLSMDWLTETLQSLTKLQDIDLLNVSPILASKSRNTKSKLENLNNK
tara:strand:- start:342 stop:1097 length:756 start_codon:yes stop_codon:yes gene_type:complete